MASQFPLWVGALGGAIDVTVEPSTLALALTLQTPEAYVAITTWEELDAMRDGLDGHYRLMNNLDSGDVGYATYAGPTANGNTGWNPVGTELAAFTGGLDGQGYSLSDIFIDRDDIDVGLFGYSKSSEGIKNIKIIACDITGGGSVLSVGGLIGFNHWDAVATSNCSCSGSVGAAGGGDFVGGLIGTNYGVLSNCRSFSISVEGDHDAGGIAGYNQGDLDNCFSHGVITSDEYAGGLVGYRAAGTISKCYSTGFITGAFDGGLVGGGSGGTITDCFWDTETSGQATSAGGTGKTTAEMWDDATFTETDTVGLTNPWDFVGNPHDDVANDDIWDISDNYPFLTIFGDDYRLIIPPTFELALTQQVPTIFDSPIITPTTFALALALQTPTISIDCTVEPATFALALTLPAPTISIDCTVEPAVLPLAVELLVSTIFIGQIITPDAFGLELTFQSSTISIDYLFEPTTFAVVSTLRTSHAMSGYAEMTPTMHAALIDSYSGGAWLWLVEIYIPGYEVIYLARNTEDIVYAGFTYIANNFDVGMAPLSGDGSVPRYGLRVAQDTDYTLEDKINATQGACGGVIKIIRAHEDFLTYFITELEQVIAILSAGSDTAHVSFTLGMPDPLLRKIPLRRYSSKKCPYALPGLFKGIECGYVGADTTCTGKLTDCDAKGNVTRWGGELGLDPNVAKV